MLRVKDLNERLHNMLRMKASSLIRWYHSLVHVSALDGWDTAASEGKESHRSHVADLQHVKDPYNGVEVTIIGRITGHFSPAVLPSLLGSLALLWTWRHLAVKVGTSKEQGSTVSLQAAVHLGHWSPGSYRRRKLD
jgi:hypothetical protein